MVRKIETYGGYFEVFQKRLTEKEKEKIEYGLMLLETQDRVPARYIGYIQDGLFELRIEYNSNIYRVFFIFDDGNIVVLFNGFQKKTQKTPVGEIKKALKIKQEYYANKGTQKQSSNR
jgi:phage-related protein